MINEVFLICIFVLAAGACIGSFLNVVGLRAISKESIVLPPSKCPLCGEPIKWYDNIPVFSYFFTFRGKCRNCGGKVSIQYPIVEALTAILFFVVFLAFGFTLKTLLILILFSISIVISITDIKRNEIYDIHSWPLIITAIITGLYFKGLNNYADVAIGLITGVFVMEALARISYYILKKKSGEEKAEEGSEETTADTEAEKLSNQTIKEETSDDEEIDINEYAAKNKRAFGEADTYLAAAAGALLGWKYLLAALALAIILQAVCILPGFLTRLYRQKEYKLLISLSVFIFLALLYWGLSNIFTLHLYVVFAFVIALIIFAVDTITRLRRTVNENGFASMPFGPPLLCSAYLVLFFGTNIISFLKHYIFMNI